MSENTLTVENREGKGRGVARRLRKSGRIPAVIYGPSGSRSLSIKESEFRQLMRKLRGSAAIIDIADGKGSKMKSILQEVLRDPVTDEFVHVDLREVSADQAITVSIPLHIIGESTGVKNENGVLDVILHDIEIKCLPKDLPESIELDISALEIGQGIHISDLKQIKGVTFQGDPVTVIVTCSAEKIEEEPEVVVAVEGEEGEEGEEGAEGAEGAEGEKKKSEGEGESPDADAKAEDKGKKGGDSKGKKGGDS